MIAGKDAEIEDLKKRLVALEEQLAEERDNLKKTKVYVRGEGRGVVVSERVCTGANQIRKLDDLHVHVCVHIRRTWKRPRVIWRRTERSGEGAGWSRACASRARAKVEVCK